MLALNLNDITRGAYEEVVIRTCKSIIANPYYTLGEFVSSVSDEELDVLTTYVENLMNCKEGDASLPSHALHSEFKTIATLAMMLASAEGTSVLNEAVCNEIISTLAVTLSLEELARAGNIILNRESLTFFEDHLIARKVDDALDA